MTTDDRALADLIEWRKQLLALPIEGPVPEDLDRAIRLRFNTARDDLMSGDSGNIIHRPGHGLDLILAIEALERPADRLEAFHAKPVVGERWTDGEWQRLLRIVHAAITENAPGGLTPGRIDVLADSVMHALDDDQAAALQSPPPVVSDLSPPTQRMEKILDAPFLRRSPPVVSGEASWHDDRQTREEIVDEAISGLKADLAELAPVVEEGRREAAAKAFLAVHYDWQGDPELW